MDSSRSTLHDRPAAVAGTFYPAEPGALRRDVQRYLSLAEPRVLTGDLRAILVPHAGYVYSGQVAAEAFRQLTGEWEMVVLLGPAHHEAVRGASVWSGGSFLTPLGAVPVNEKVARELLEESDLFVDSRSPHQAEHSLEVELPFLQETLQVFDIVPVLMNTDDLEVCRQVGRALAKVLAQRKALLVISSDLSHYPDRETARRADRTSLLALERMDPEFLKQTSGILLERGDRELHCTFCGEAALLAGLEALNATGAMRTEILHYANSADVPKGDPDRVVGYAAAAFVKENEAGRYPDESRPDCSPGASVGAAPSPEGWPGGGPVLGTGFRRYDNKVSLEGASVLLKAARSSIEEGLQKKALRMGPLSDDPVLNLPLNVFVTLWLDRELQGCIGSIQPRETLLDAVRRLARDSAFDDPRGIPLGPADLPRLKVEISILSPFRRMPDAGAIEVGMHGVLLSKGSRRGLFLPDVWEHFSRKDDFLDALCEQKMGLPGRSWQNPDMIFEVFTTQKIEE